MSAGKVVRKSFHLKLREEDIQLLKTIAKKFDVSETDIIRMALKKFAEELGVDKP